MFRDFGVSRDSSRLSQMVVLRHKDYVHCSINQDVRVGRCSVLYKHRHVFVTFFVFFVLGSGWPNAVSDQYQDLIEILNIS